MTALALIVYVTRNAVLRSREFYADLAAARESDVAEELMRLIGRNPRRKWYSPFGVHPDPEDRRAVLRCPGRMLRQTESEAFLVGVITAVGFSTTVMVMANITVAFRSVLAPLIGLLSNLPWHIAASLFTPLLAWVTGTAAWRRALCGEGLPEEYLGYW